jgi:hypothetical protein
MSLTEPLAGLRETNRISALIDKTRTRHPREGAYVGYQAEPDRPTCLLPTRPATLQTQVLAVSLIATRTCILLRAG